MSKGPWHQVWVWGGTVLLGALSCSVCVYEPMRAVLYGPLSVLRPELPSSNLTGPLGPNFTESLRSIPTWTLGHCELYSCSVIRSVHLGFYLANRFNFYEWIIKPQGRTLTSSFGFIALCRQYLINNRDNTTQLIKIGLTTQKTFENDED